MVLPTWLASIVESKHESDSQKRATSDKYDGHGSADYLLLVLSQEVACLSGST